MKQWFWDGTADSVVCAELTAQKWAAFTVKEGIFPCLLGTGRQHISLTGATRW